MVKYCPCRCQGTLSVLRMAIVYDSLSIGLRILVNINYLVPLPRFFILPIHVEHSLCQSMTRIRTFGKGLEFQYSGQSC